MRKISKKLSVALSGCLAFLTPFSSGLGNCYAAHLGTEKQPAVVSEIQSVKISASTFPDANFRAVISSPDYDRDGHGILDEDEIINDYPVSYYMAGKLYPQECRFETNHVSSEDLGETDDEQELQLDEGYVPSSMGMSFSLSSNGHFELQVSVANDFAN